MKSLLGKNEAHVLTKMQSLVEKAERFDVQKEDIDNLKNDIEKLREENYYLKNKLDTKRDIIEDMESDLDIKKRK